MSLKYFSSEQGRAIFFSYKSFVNIVKLILISILSGLYNLEHFGAISGHKALKSPIFDLLIY